MDVWIVTQGEYSSYSVIAAFTTVEAADEFARISNLNYDGYSRYEVERIDLDPPNPEIVRRVTKEAEPIQHAAPACLSEEMIQALRYTTREVPPESES